MVVPLHNLVDTWSDANQIFSALKLNVTDMGSAPESHLMDFQINGASRFTVSKTGAIAVASSTAGSVLSHDPTASPGSGGYQFRLAHGPIALGNGPAGKESYVSDIWAFGVNVATPSARLDAGKPYLALHFDSLFFRVASSALSFSFSSSPRET